MSDKLLQNIHDEIKGLRADLAGKAAAGGAPSKTTPAATPPKADKAAAAPPKPGANKPAAADKAAAKPAASTKAPGGKHSESEVREAIRQVATNDNLGKQEALSILDENGGGAQNITALKPEFYDAVYEACQVAIKGAGTPAAAADEGDPDDPLA